LLVELGVGLAERGQRRVENRRWGWIKIGLDSYVDPDSFTLHWTRCTSHPQATSIWLCEDRKYRFGRFVTAVRPVTEVKSAKTGGTFQPGCSLTSRCRNGLKNAPWGLAGGRRER
jgi:hypothetical protein